MDEQWLKVKEQWTSETLKKTTTKMEGLADYSSEDDQVRDQEKAKATADSEDESNDSESSDGDGQGDVARASTEKPAAPPQGASTASTAPCNKRRLPSSSALLSGGLVKPSFLTARSSGPDGFELPAVEAPSSASVKRQGEDQRSDPSKRPNAGPPPDSIESKLAEVQSKIRAEKDKNKKDSDVKDKLKAARLKGQSAHARWKSEGEMLLRQQYD